MYSRDCGSVQGTCKDEASIMYAWARNAPPTILPKGWSAFVWRTHSHVWQDSCSLTRHSGPSEPLGPVSHVWPFLTSRRSSAQFYMKIFECPSMVFSRRLWRSSWRQEHLDGRCWKICFLSVVRCRLQSWTEFWNFPLCDADPLRRHQCV